MTLRRVGIAASAIHRQNPGFPLRDAIDCTDSLPRARALRAVGELGLTSRLAELKEHLEDEDDLCRFWAAWSMVLSSADPKALAILESIAESTMPYRDTALKLAVRRMGASAAETWRDRLAQSARLIRNAILVAGALGDPTSIPWLLEQMKVPELARVTAKPSP